MRNFIFQWYFDITGLLLILAICIFYLYMLRFKPVQQAAYFFSGILVLIISVTLPLQFPGMDHAFSLHMISHVLLLLVAAPLMVLGIPANNRYAGSFKRLSRMLQKWPFIGWFTGIGIMWFWHIPAVYRHLMQWHAMHPMGGIWGYVHTSSLLMAGMIFSWVVLGPYPPYRIAPLKGILYLATACIGCSLLGLLITFAPAGLYAMSTVVLCGNGFAKAPYDWDMAHTADQQIAGLIMWVPCCFIYLAGVLFLIKQWLHEKDENMAVDLSL